MRTILLAGAAVLALSQISYAQAPSNNTNPASANQSAQKERAGTNLQNMLQKSGYTDIRVSPTSFMVHAKDSDGNPVVMSISPDAFTEVTDVNASSASTTGSAASSNRSDTGRFVANLPTTS